MRRRTPSTPSTCCRWSRSCAGERTAPETTARAAAMLPRASAWQPLVAAHARSTASSPTGCSRRCGARRCGSSHDDVATVEEIDDAIRLGAGLRWAFMGTLPHLPDRRRRGRHAPLHGPVRAGAAVAVDAADGRARADRRAARPLVAQSDAQAAGRSVRELERVRDDCLVAILQALRSARLRAPASVLERLRARRSSTAAPGAAAGRRRRGRCACTATAVRPSGSTTTATRTRAATCRCSATRPTPCCATSASTPPTWRRAAATSRSRRTSRFLHEARAGEAAAGRDAGARARRQAPAPVPPRCCARPTRASCCHRRAAAAARRHDAAPRRAGRRRGAGARRPPSRSATPPCPGPRRPAARIALERRGPAA